MRLAALLLVLACTPVGSQTAQRAGIAAAPIAATHIPEGMLTGLEKGIDGRLVALDPMDPIDMLGGTRALYLPGYGTVFTTELSLIVTPGNFPIATSRYTPEFKAQVRQRKLARLPKLEEAMKEMVKMTALTLRADARRSKDCAGGARTLSARGRYHRASGADRDERRQEIRQIGRRQDGNRVVATTIPHDLSIDGSAASAPDLAADESGSPYQRLGEILIERGKIEPEDLERALELQQERGDKLGKILVDMGLIAQRDVLAALSDQTGRAARSPSTARRLPRPKSKASRSASCASAAPFPSRWRTPRSPSRWPIRWISKPSPPCAPFPVCRFAPRWPPSRKFSTPSRSITAKPSAQSLAPIGDDEQARPISNTCATWPAKRRSSAW